MLLGRVLYIFVQEICHLAAHLHKDHLELFKRVQRGDKAAFAQVYDAYSEALFGLCVSILGSEEEAADALQDACVKIWKNAGRFDPAKARLFTWMLNITRNTCIDRYRKLAKTTKVDIQAVDKSVDISKASQIKVDHIGLKDLASELRPEQLKMIEFLYYRGYTQQEVADDLDMPLGTVKTTARTAIHELRKIFKVR